MAFLISGLEDSCVEMPHGRVLVVDVCFLPRPARFCAGILPFPKGGFLRAADLIVWFQGWLTTTQRRSLLCKDGPKERDNQSLL